jgi:spore maturation protein CgeB
MKIAFFASSLVSAYWNGAATYYRGIVRALASRGHDVTFFEPDAYDRQQHRDIPDPPWATVVVYPPEVDAVHKMIECARDSDLVVKASGVGVFDELLERLVLDLQGPRTLVAYWDVDAPATLDRVSTAPADPLRALIPRYDIVFTYGGGPPIVRGYTELGARRCVPIYNALDPETHLPVDPDPRFEAALGFLGNRLPDRERRVEEFFLAAATQLADRRFLLGGAGWQDKPLPPNVSYVGHVYTRDHNAFNCTPLAVLNVSRESMASYGYSPATRVFEAAGAGACLITDEWVGIEKFLEPEREILVAANGDDVARHVRSLTPAKARAIGDRAYQRMLREHTYAHRARDVETALGERTAAIHRAPTADKLSFVFLGLSITSSWGNGHASTYRSLVRELAARGHDVLFLERDVPWYADNRDLSQPPYGRTSLYRSLAELRDRFTSTVREADVVVVGSYVPDGIEVGRWVQENARGVAAFYDIDTPVTLAALASGRCEYLAEDQIRDYDLYLSFTGGPTLTEIECELGAPHARALYCSVDPELYAPEPLQRRWDLAYMGTYSVDRQPGVQRFVIEPARRAPGRNFVVAGPQYPDAIEWPTNVERIEHLAPDGHRAFYNRAAFALNLTRREMVTRGYSPSVRLFEAAACGVPIISDVWPGIEELLEPGREILLARGADDLLRFMELPESRRAAIGSRGRARILAEHTAAHRASQLERYVREVM